MHEDDLGPSGKRPKSLMRFAGFACLGIGFALSAKTIQEEIQDTDETRHYYDLIAFGLAVLVAGLVLLVVDQIRNRTR